VPQLTSKVPVHVFAPQHDALTLWPNDEIPDWAVEFIEPALRGAADEPPAETSPASSGENSGASEEELRKLTNDELRELLGEGNYAASDRKDDLVAKALAAQAGE